MNLKFYLRGLGIGIIVTAVIMLILSYQNTNHLTDTQIKQRAKELGMVEANDTLSQMVSNKESEVSPAPESGDAVGENTDTDSTTDAVDTDEENASDTQTDNEGNEEDISSSGNLDYNEVEQQIEEADEQLSKIQGKEQVSTPEPTKTPEPVKTPEPTKTPEPVKTPEPTKEPAKADGNTISFVISKGESSYTVAKNLKAAGLIEDAAAFDTYLCQTGQDRKIHADSYELSDGLSEEEIADIIAGK